MPRATLVVLLWWLSDLVVLAGRYRDIPFELWDFRGSALLKIMPSSFPLVAGLEWSVTGLPRKKAPGGAGGSIGLAAAGGMEGLDRKLIDPTVMHASANTSSPTRFNNRGAPENTTVFTREHMVVTTPEGHILHFTVDGSVVR